MFKALTLRKKTTQSPNNCRNDIEKLLRGNELFIVGQSWCSYTQKAINSAPENTTYVLLDEHRDAIDVADWLMHKYNHWTVPLVFHGGVLLGGSEAVPS